MRGFFSFSAKDAHRSTFFISHSAKNAHKYMYNNLKRTLYGNKRLADAIGPGAFATRLAYRRI
jgi:hypothetical protein